MENCDIVYVLKDTEENEELSYSIRSVMKNFPHKRIVFVGGCPKWQKPDLYIPYIQKKDKWANASDLIKLACKNDELSKDIVLFNDDFFVLKPVKQLKTYKNKSLERLCEVVTKGGRKKSEYIKDRIKPAIQKLRSRGLTTYNYELHVPMKINREKMLTIYRLFPEVPAKRSLYGNYWHIGGTEIAGSGMDDGSVQIVGTGIKFERDFVSTTDETWNSLAGEQIKKLFPYTTRYDIEIIR